MRSAPEEFRRRVLEDAYVDRVNLRRVDWQARQQYPVAEPVRWRQDVIEAIQSLAQDGFVEVGYPTLDGGFIALPLADALRHLHEIYVAHYDEPSLWGRCIWLNLTVNGKAFVCGTQHGEVNFLGDRRARRRTNGRAEQ